jgi:hypothetical protein
LAFPETLSLRFPLPEAMRFFDEDRYGLVGVQQNSPTNAHFAAVDEMIELSVIER